LYWLGTTLEFFIMEPSKHHFLDGVVGIEQVRGTIDTIVVIVMLHLLLISSKLVLILTVPKDTHGSNGWRMDSPSWLLCFQ
jgi:hypothetical protein